MSGFDKPIKTDAHFFRMLYASGKFTKAGLVEYCMRLITEREDQIRELNAPADVKDIWRAQLPGLREALDEVNGLPDDQE